ncbi:MAG: hypothetical protein K5766_02525 [Alphaproteobacteria bacterium]|nr:hypothetical protein [Alphaproteobacteria bacterium]
MEKYIERWLQKGLIDSATSRELMEDMVSEKVRLLKLRFNANALIIAILWVGFQRGYEKKDQILIGIMNTCTMVYLISNYYHWG